MRNGEDCGTFPESETLACYTQWNYGNPGGPEALDRVWRNKRYKARKPNGVGESDCRIVPKKPGNAGGGKAATKEGSC